MMGIAGFTEVCGPGQPSAHQQVGRDAQQGRHAQWGRQAFISMPYSWVSNIKTKQTKEHGFSGNQKEAYEWGNKALRAEVCRENIV